MTTLVRPQSMSASTAFAIATALATLTPAAHAVSAKELSLACREFIKPEATREPFAAGVCAGYLAGYTGGLRNEAIIQAFMNGNAKDAAVKSACLPEEGVSARGLALALWAHSMAKPSVLDGSADDLMSSMLSASYSCIKPR